MELIFELLKQLSDTLENPVTFLLVLSLIIILTTFSVKLVIKSVKSGGFWAMIFKSKDHDDLRVVKAQIASFVATHSESVDKILDSIKVLHADTRENGDSLREEITNFVLLRKDIETSKSEMLKEMDDIRDWLKMHDVVEQQLNTNLKDLVHKILDLLAKMNIQVEKIDEFIRGIVPEFRTDHKEINRGIAELSKDIALIERTIQTQMSSTGLKLRQ